MFENKINKIGSIEVVSIYNEDQSFGIEVIPSHGGLINSLTLYNKNIIEGIADENEIKQNNAYKSTFLAPFPNRLKDGTYKFEGQEYQLPINETPLNNALHGFIYNAPFKILKINLEKERAEVFLEYKYNGNISGFPFPFNSNIILALDVKTGFSCQFHFTNLAGNSIPFGYGWHPYFQLGGSVDTWELQFPAAKQYTVDDQMIPTGESIINKEFTSLKSIKGVNLDDCFEIIDTGEIVNTVLRNVDKFEITLWQETGGKKLNFLQIYTPPHRKSIAIEPQTSCINAFNNGIGLFRLEANETIKTIFGIKIKIE